MTGLVTGRIVYYVFDAASAAEVMRRRTTGASIATRIKAANQPHGDLSLHEPSHFWPVGAQAHIGNPVRAGDVCPAMVVAVLRDEVNVAQHRVSLQVFLDGCDVYWARGVAYEEWSGEIGGSVSPPRPGTWHWMFSGQQSRYTPTPLPGA